MVRSGIRNKRKKPIYVCSECGTDFINEEYYHEHMEEGCDEVT